MNSSVHPIEQEELMAYLDGELTPERASALAAHLEQCAECRAAVAESRALSERLTAWQVEPAPSSLTERMTAAMAAGEIKPRGRGMSPAAGLRPRQFALPRWAWAAAGGVCLALLITAVSIPNLLRSRSAGSYSVSAPGRPMPAPTTVSEAVYQVGVSRSGSVAAGTLGKLAGGGEENLPISIPMIARTASLTLLTKDFDQTRVALEDVVRRHRGYSAQLTVGSEAGKAHRLSASFRVPADQLDATIAAIKQLARVEQESQGGEEVTTQYVDLQARLSNARRTEQTVLEVLEKRTGKLSDVLAVEEELARVREEIERMEAELKSLQNRVSFSTLQVELREEYQAQLEISPTLGTRMGNAMVEGFRTAADSLMGVVLFFLNVGPFLLLWALILFLPARYVWRRVRTARKPK